MKKLDIVWRRLPAVIRNGKWGRILSNKKYNYYIEKYLKNYNIQEPELFRAIEIETINRCNGKCSFCPVNIYQEQRVYAKMTEEIFKKIIGELESINYQGTIALFSNNEPFLDDRIIEWNKYMRSKLPKAYIYLYTNGSLLDIEKLEELLPVMDRMVIDNYEMKKEKILEITTWCSTNALGKKVEILNRKQDEILSSRGGQAPNKNDVKTINEKCFYPFQQLIIRPDGKISLCCNDALGKYTLGDVNNNSLTEIWNSEEYKTIRREMKKNGRKNLLLCNKCDTRQYVMKNE